MPVRRMSLIQQHLKRLDQAVDELKTVMKDQEPPADLCHLYTPNHEDYKRDFRYIDPDELDYKLGQLVEAIKLIKQLKKSCKEDRLPQ